MAGRTRVLSMRLKHGGVLVVAPSSVLPWPRVLSPASRSLQISALRKALVDPAAMKRLRSEYNQLLGVSVARSPGLISDQALVQELMRAASRGRLTVIFGHIESTSSERPSRSALKTVFEGHPVIARQSQRIRPPPDPRGQLPAPGAQLPRTFQERLTWVVGRAPLYMDEEAAARFREFFDPEGLQITVAILLLWAASHVVGVGFVVDAALFAAAVWQLGSAALLAFEQLKQFFDLTRSAQSWAELDRASRLFALAIVGLGVEIFRRLLRRVGSRTGGKSSEQARPVAPAQTGTAAKPRSTQTESRPWSWGGHKSSAKWRNQMAKRGWTEQQITEAVRDGKAFNAPNNVSPANGARRHVHPTTGRSIVVDAKSGELLHIGGDGFEY